MTQRSTKRKRAERRAAPKPARIPRAAKRPLWGLGDRPMYSSDEGRHV